jgi:S-DNA-T family DNA segregation ATPase FtsK/SpoIIIE
VLRAHSGAPAVAETPAWHLWLGLAVLLAASAALEWTRLYQWEPLIAGGNAGGVLGYSLGKLSQSLLGFAGSGVLWIAVLVAGVSLGLGFSWLGAAERIGRGHRVAALAPGLAPRARPRTCASARRRCASARRSSRSSTSCRSITCRSSSSRPWSTCRRAPASSRNGRKPLFSELVDTKLPQVDLLDSAPQRQETVSGETLEMTSRLIEKKLKDFGVEVRVVAASPGPVITRYEIEPAVGVKGAQVVNLAKDLARSLSLVSIRVVETDSRQDDDGARAAQRQAADDPPLRSARLAGLCRLRLAADDRPRQGHRRPADGRRPGEDAALPGGGHHRRRQVGRHQRDDPEPALQGRGARRPA